MVFKKRSFLDRLSGPAHDDLDAYEDEVRMQPAAGGRTVYPSAPLVASTVEEETVEGTLPVDVYQTPNEIIIRAFVAGVRADELNVSISRDMVVIEGSREERDSVSDADYFARELFWGSFSKTILLPQEVDVDTSTASAKDGLLTLTLPKHDKARQTKIRVKAG
jgi:HSP20 family molecular chaperone IbpA